jgi:hypothetical protein
MRDLASDRGLNWVMQVNEDRQTASNTMSLRTTIGHHQGDIFIRAAFDEDVHAKPFKKPNEDMRLWLKQ